MEIAGAPTFEEFRRNPEKWLGKPDDGFGLVDNGSHLLKQFARKHVYEIEGFRCKTLEEVERIAKDHGIPLRQLDYRPELIPIGGGKCDILVKFVSTGEREKRAGWV